MANIKFSAFTQKVVQTNVDFLVGYTGADNVRITPAALGDGIYLPLGGGTMVGNLKLNNSVRLELGTTADGEFWHDGNDLYMTNTTGDMYLTNKADDKDIIFQSDDGSGGYETYFYLDGSNATGAPQTIFPENCYLNFGNNSDLKILHAGGNSTMQNDTGDWYMRQTANDKDIIILCDDGAGGHTPYITLDGSAAQTQVDMDFSFTDNVKAKFGSSGDLEIYHDGSDSYIRDTGTGYLKITASRLRVLNPSQAEEMIDATENGAVELYYDGAKTFETTATGIQVTDEVSIGTSIIHTGDTDTKVSFGTDEIVLTTAGADAVTVTADGKVGIGIATPVEKLTVFGEVSSTNTNSTSSTAGANRAIMNLTLGGARLGHYRGTTAAGSGSVKIYSDSVLALTIDENQKVGIGTATPGYKLDVDNSVAGDWVGRFKNTSATGYGLYIEGSSNDAQYLLGLNNGISYKFIVTGAGNVGIGTTTPTAALQVVGLVEYADNAAALTAGLTAGAFYRTGDLLKVVH